MPWWVVLLLASTLATFEGPVLGVWGRDDATGLPERVASALRMGSDVRPWEVVDGAGHWVQYQRPAQVNAALLKWFSS